MSFDEFCTTNIMTEVEKVNFEKYLEKQKDDKHSRPIKDWLDVFNDFFDR